MGSLSKFDRQVLSTISKYPNSSGFILWQKLNSDRVDKSAFGKFLPAVFFGPSIGSLYVSFAKLERLQLISSEWGVATRERGWNRPRLYQLASSQVR